MRVAAYCRVSTDREDQANSFESQQRYFRACIQAHAGWELCEIYADEGISGTSTKKRAAFQRMMEDARRRRFDLILTKEISRFARNTLDSIRYIRELKRMGIGVVFLTDNMNTLDETSEFILTIKASQAQEESRATSARVKWGQTRRMEQGVVFGRSLLGYDVRNGAMEINPEGAEIVRSIFHKYVHEGKGASIIARELREAGIQTLSGRTQWRSSVILKILRNEKYCGDLCQKKTFTPDYLTHQKKYNHGEEPFVCLRDHHPPIISRELWNAAQAEMARRNPGGQRSSGHGNRYPLSGKLRCAGCGRSFVARKRRGRDGTAYRIWRCGTATEQGRAHVDPAGNPVGCDVGYQIRDEAAMEMLKYTVSLLEMDREAVADEVSAIILRAMRLSREHDRQSREQARNDLVRTMDKKRGLLDAYLSQTVSADDLRLMNETYDRTITALRNQIAEAEAALTPEADPEERIRSEVWRILSGERVTDGFCGRLLDHITACPDRVLEVRLNHLEPVWRFRLEAQTKSS